MGTEPTMTEKGWNPYFVSYAVAHRTTPQRLIELAAAKGGSASVGFILWMSGRLREWRMSYGPTLVHGVTGPKSVHVVPESASGGPCGDLERAHFAGWLRGTAMRMAEENT